MPGIVHFAAPVFLVGRQSEAGGDGVVRLVAQYAALRNDVGVFGAKRHPRRSASIAMITAVSGKHGEALKKKGMAENVVCTFCACLDSSQQPLVWTIPLNARTRVGQAEALPGMAAAGPGACRLRR